MVEYQHGRVAELVDALDSKSGGSNVVRVQVPPRPPEKYPQAFAWGIFLTWREGHRTRRVRPPKADSEL